MAGRWWAVLVLVPLVAGAESVEPLPLPPVESALALPWPDMAGRPVLHVERITDLKALLTVQALLRDRGGVNAVRLLGVSGSDAWFVADSLPTGGWRAMLATEPRLRLSAPGRAATADSQEAAVPLLESAIWDASVAAPEAVPLTPPALPSP